MRALVLAACMALGSSPSLAQRAKSIGRLPVEVVSRISWQGQELKLRKVISCDQRQRMHPGTEGDRAGRLSAHAIFSKADCGCRSTSRATTSRRRAWISFLLADQKPFIRPTVQTMQMRVLDEGQT